MLKDTDLTPEQGHYVSAFGSAEESLLSLINDILDFSKVESVMITLENIAFNLMDVINRLCEVMAIRAHKKQIELTYRIAPETTVWLIGDPGRLRQIIINLIGNAINFCIGLMGFSVGNPTLTDGLYHDDLEMLTGSLFSCG